jgi:hypothetical protein
MFEAIQISKYNIQVLKEGVSLKTPTFGRRHDNLHDACLEMLHKSLDDSVPHSA